MLYIYFSLIIIFCLFFPISSQVRSGNDWSNEFVREDNLCFPITRHRSYIELNEKAKLFIQDIPHPTLTNGTGQCLLEIVTCPSCVIKIKVLSFSTFAKCDFINLSIYEGTSSSKTVWCYENGIKEKQDSLEYRSHSRSINLSLNYSKDLIGQLFVLEYTSYKNRIEIFGDRFGQAGLISSPIFPLSYPKDLTSEWIFSCRLISDCQIRIIFRDYQVETASILEVLDVKGKRIEVFGGNIYRPPILSNNQGIQLRFHANGASGKGFIAEYYFVNSSKERTVSDCGGFVDNTGGTITMLEMISTNISVKEFDCLWLIKPIESYNHPKTHLYLKVAVFQDMVNPSQIQVIEGLDSTGPLLETIRGNDVEGVSHIVPAHLGIYIRLQGNFINSSKIAIIYSAFNYANCFAPVVYPCQNHRCISAHLVCDGFDHCGDGSDEPRSCSRDWDHTRHESHWHSNTPNYYFPKLERYPDLKTATLAFLGASLGLLLVISALLILLYRLGARSRHQRQLRNQLQTISELLENARAEEPTNSISSLVVPEQPPPIYEPPPEYDQVIKMDIPPGFGNRDESEISDDSHSNHQNSHKTKRNRHGTRMSKSRSHCRNGNEPEIQTYQSQIGKISSPRYRIENENASPPPDYSHILNSHQNPSTSILI